MTKWDVVVVTEDRFVTPNELDDFITNILLEDKLIIDALVRLGLKVKRVAWSDPSFGWQSTRSILIRATWDYFFKPVEYRHWLDKVSLQTKLINPYELLLWNMEKHYLFDLKASGVSIPPTYLVKQGQYQTMQDISEQTGWETLIVKPVIAGAARETYKLVSQELAGFEEKFRSLISQESMLIQEFQKSVEEFGELSLVYIGGVYTHAVRKVPKHGDFRVQDDFGGSVLEYQATDDLITFGQQAIAACAQLPAYARVDIIIDNQGRPTISELELIEPELWFRNSSVAAQKLADVIHLGLS